MSTNGVREEVFGPADFAESLRQDVLITGLRRGFNGDYFATVRISATVTLRDGRVVQIEGTRKVRGKCVNARPGRPKR